jgi:hypothetical protein
VTTGDKRWAWSRNIACTWTQWTWGIGDGLKGRQVGSRDKRWAAIDMRDNRCTKKVSTWTPSIAEVGTRYGKWFWVIFSHEG